MTLAGVVGNFAFGGKPPMFFKTTLTTLGNAYSAGALLMLGGSIAG